MIARLTTFEAALLRGLGLPAPTVEQVKGSTRLEYRAVIVRPSGRTIEALGSSAEDATDKVVRLAVRR